MSPYNYIKILDTFPDLTQLDDNHICVRCPVCGKIDVKSLNDMKLHQDSKFGKEIKYIIYICLDCYENDNNLNLFTEGIIDAEYYTCSYTCPILCYNKYMNIICEGECTYVS